MVFRMMRLLASHPELSQRDLARELGISLGAAHYCLNALVEKGFVKLRNFSKSRHKQRYAYVLTTAGMKEKTALAQSFLRRKWDEYVALRNEIDSLRQEIGTPDSEAGR